VAGTTTTKQQQSDNNKKRFSNNNKHKEELAACVRDLQQQTMHMIDASSYFRAAQCSTSLINMNDFLFKAIFHLAMRFH
jgi:hypothetical protein